MSVLSEKPPHTVSSLLALSVSEVRSFTRIVVSGELDLSTVEELRGVLTAHRIPGQQILLDLSGVSFMDSSGICAVLEADAAARSDGHRFIITRLSRAVQRVLEMSGACSSLRASGNWPQGIQGKRG